MSDPSSLARFACSTCRRQKRKCSRQLPACQLCRKNRRRCDYPAEAVDGLTGPDNSPIAGTSPSTSATTATTATTASSATSLHARPRWRDPATSLFFLDSYIFQLSHATTVQPVVELPPECLQLLACDVAQVQADVAVYFTRFHPVFPIISKISMRRLDLTAPLSCAADGVFLLLAMRLVCRSLDPNADAAALSLCYSCAKRCSACLEAAGSVSLRRLQGCLLLAHYEIAQALYPAAYMTVGACARLGQMMGLHSGRKAPQFLPQIMSVIENEEARRVWWATVVLDRYINIGLDDRPFACRDANPDDQLPMDEAHWDAGESTIRPSLAVTAEAFVAAPPFARTCQAAHLLSRVLHHCNTEPAPTKDFEAFYQEALQLHRVVSSFAVALWEEVQQAQQTPAGPAAAHALFPSLGICLSTQLSLYDVHLCADVDFPAATGMKLQLETQTLALDSAKAAVLMIIAFAEAIRSALSNPLPPPLHDDDDEASTNTYPDAATDPIVSPLAINCLFQAAKLTAWYYRDTGREDLLDALGMLKTALEDMGTIFHVANECLTILDMKVFTDFTA